MSSRGDQKGFEKLPPELPVFPLTGVLLLPRGNLPLNIFEKRYLAMVDDAMAANRLIGMIQPKEDGTLYKTGCAGRISSYQETPDGRYEITLTGVSRFAVLRELPQRNGFRRIEAGWDHFTDDLEELPSLGVDRPRLSLLLKNYFQKHGLTCSWNAIEGAADDKLITCLAMICPFEPQEKQALLEAPCCKSRAELFMALLEMDVSGQCGCRH